MASLPPPPGGPGWAPAPARGAEPSRWTARAALLVAFLACIIGVVGWFRPVSAPPRVEPAPTYTAAEVQAAKDKVCEAFELVDKALRATSNAEAGGDEALRQALAANARLALTAGSLRLQDSVEPALERSLATTIDTFARITNEMSIRYLAGESRKSADIEELVRRAESLEAELLSECGAR